MATHEREMRAVVKAHSLVWRNEALVSPSPEPVPGHPQSCRPPFCKSALDSSTKLANERGGKAMMSTMVIMVEVAVVNNVKGYSLYIDYRVWSSHCSIVAAL